MEKIKSYSVIILLALTGVFFSSCSSDGDDVSASSLVGTWELQRIYGWEVDPDTGEKGNYDDVIKKGGADYQVYTFNEDGTYTWEYEPGTRWTERDSGKYSVDGNTLVMKGAKVGTVSVSGNKLSIHLKDSSGEATMEFVRIN